MASRCLAAFILSFLPAALSAQPDYLYRYGTSSASECPAAVAPGRGGEVLAAGLITAAGNTDGLLMLVRADGPLQSAKQIAGTGDDSFQDVKRTADGGFIAVGSTNSFGAGLSDGLIMKLSATGAPGWWRTFGSVRDDHFVRVVQTQDRGYAVLGDIANVDTGNDLILVKFNPSGGVMWKKTLATSGFDHASGLVATADGGVLVSSNADSGGGKTIAVLTRFTPVGGILWSRSYRSSYSFHAGASVLEAADGSIVFLQHVAQGININSRSVVSRLSSTGSPLWSRIIRLGTTPVAIFSGALASGGGVVLAGTSGSSPARGLLLELDSTGRIVWKKAMQLAATSLAVTSVSADSGGQSFLVAACASAPGSSDMDAALLRIETAGAFEGGCGALPSAPVVASAFGVRIGSVTFTQPEVAYSTVVPALRISNRALPSGRVCGIR